MKKYTCSLLRSPMLRAFALTVMISLDALLHRKFDYGKWDQGNTPSYPHKREDQIHRGD